MRLSRLAQEEIMNAEVPSHPRFDVYRAVTNNIITAIEAGAGEFVMPWHGDGVAIAKPQNALTQMEYHGINVIALWAQAYLNGYRSGFWASYKQWQSAGAQVLRGAEGSTIVFFKKIEGEAADGEEPSVRLVARASRVFNADQVAGWQPPARSKLYGDAEITESVETFIAATKAVVHRVGGSFTDRQQSRRPRHIARHCCMSWFTGQVPGIGSRVLATGCQRKNLPPKSWWRKSAPRSCAPILG